MTTELIYKIALFYIPTVIILILYPTTRLYIAYFRYFTYKAFNKPNYWWNGTIENPRLYFSVIAYITLYASWCVSKMTISTIWFCTPLSIFLSCLGIFILYFVWSRTFENRFIAYVKQRINLYDGKTIISIKAHDTENIHREFITKWMKCNLDTFLDFVQLNEIDSNNRIKWFAPKSQLIRFIIIFFSIKTEVNKNLNHDSVRLVMQNYFTIDGQDIILTNKGSEISNIKREIDSNNEIFINLKQEIEAIVLRHKRS